MREERVGDVAEAAVDFPGSFRRGRVVVCAAAQSQQRAGADSRGKPRACSQLVTRRMAWKRKGERVCTSMGTRSSGLPMIEIHGWMRSWKLQG